jgi:hypothetical protein
MIIPPRPWQVAVPTPPAGEWVYVVDAEGRQVFATAVQRDLADFLVQVVNREGRA